MAQYLTTRNVLLAGGGIGAAMFLFPRTASKVNPLPNGIETPAVASIAERYNKGGATTTHTPGAGTPRGSADSTQKQSNPGGVTSQEFKDRIADQKKDDYGVAGKVWNKTHYDTEKGK